MCQMDAVPGRWPLGVSVLVPSGPCVVRTHAEWTLNDVMWWWWVAECEVSLQCLKLLFYYCSVSFKVISFMVISSICVHWKEVYPNFSLLLIIFSLNSPWFWLFVTVKVDGHYIWLRGLMIWTVTVLATQNRLQAIFHSSFYNRLSEHFHCYSCCIAALLL